MVVSKQAQSSRTGFFRSLVQKLAARRRSKQQRVSFAATLKLFEARPNDWLPLGVAYDGQGEATFSTNPGVLRGPTTVRFNEDGSIDEFSMLVDELVATVDPGGWTGPVFAFVNGLPIPNQPGGFTFGGVRNRCTSVVVRGDGFRLKIDQDDIIAMGGQESVSFHPVRTIVRYERSTKPRYWAVPLVNFVSKFSQALPQLHEHPLRTRRSAPLHLDTENNIALASRAYEQANCLIPFECEGDTGFIEPLHDYQQRVERIEADRCPIVTSVMVGNLPSSYFESDSEEWYPTDLIALLGLAVGRQLSAPWVELRDNEGEIVARLHHQIGTPSSSQGTRIIDEFIDRSTGVLLTRYLTSPHRGEVFLRVAVGHLLRSLTVRMTVDDRLGHLFRAAEGLAVGLGLNNGRPLEMEADARTEVEKSLNACISELERIANTSTGNNRERVMQVRGRVSEIVTNRPSFRTQLLDLIRHAGLSDAAWLREFEFKAYKNDKRVNWSRAANEYRNSVFHPAYIEFEKTFDFDNAVAFFRHFSDVLVRIVLHLIEFDGYYRSICGWHGMEAEHQQLDWAKPERLTGESLGYHG